MNNYYTLYNTTSHAIVAMSLAPSSPYTPGTGEEIATFPANDATASLAANNPQWFLVTGSPATLVMQPYWTLSAAQSASVANPYTITATLNNPPSTAPTSATMTVLGQSITEAVTSGTATFSLSVDPSVKGNAVTLSVGASGTESGATTIGAGNAIPLKAVLSGSTITVVPTNVSDYQGYLFAQFPNLFVAMQLTAAMQHLSTDMHRLEMANVTGLTANQQATLSDINTNVVPHLALSLESAQTTGATLWGQVKQGLIQFSQLQTQLETALATWYA